jgi:hypothetical protein
LQRFLINTLKTRTETRKSTARKRERRMEARS